LYIPVELTTITSAGLSYKLMYQYFNSLGIYSGKLRVNWVDSGISNPDLVTVQSGSNQLKQLSNNSQ